MTPMQRQYNEIKQQYPEDIVLFRLGDFYEAFHEDAKTLSQVLGITLTGRGKGDKRIPMAGIPHHALDNYLPKIVAAGLKVVMVDQTSEPEQGKLVEREVSRVFTAGTLLEENTLDESKNNYIVSISESKGKYGVAVCDISVGKIQLFEVDAFSRAKAELERIDPSEFLISTGLASTISKAFRGRQLSFVPRILEPSAATAVLYEQFEVLNFKGFGVDSLVTAQQAAAQLVEYLRECQRENLQHLKQMSHYQFEQFVRLDSNTIRNLELIYPSSGSDLKTTVFHHLNECKTSMGKRMLRNWLLRPLIEKHKLQDRWDAVEFLVNRPILLSDVRSHLGEIADIERIVGRIGVASANARDLKYLEGSLAQVLESIELFKSNDSETEMSTRIRHIVHELESASVITEVCKEISTRIKEDPPASTTEGGMIKSGYDSTVDELRKLKSGGKQTLAEIQARESSDTGISSLKVGFNKVFGYYIEVTKIHSDKVPEHYIRKQTLTNAERYITEELKQWEQKVLTAEDQLNQIEYDLLVELRSQIASRSQELLYVADMVAELDVLASFASTARQRNFCKPEISPKQLTISGGRHLVVEALQENFTPNETELNSENFLSIITGPNMSGKSTFIRQVALITLLAQVGSFVPATRMQFEPITQLFTRVGAADNLAKGESTFMVEMSETANILNNADERSLVILDEIGRGTSTYDGVAIAWAIVEHIHEQTKAKTLFATHYHELTELASSLKGVNNLQVQVLEQDDNIQFMHKIIPGATGKSYGVHVAKIAGIPEQVTTRAAEILDSLENSEQQIATDNQHKQTDQVPKHKLPRPKHVSEDQIRLL